MQTQRRRGFTLIEMLVVIAVILILAAILAPAIKQAKEYGRNARCSSNLRQLQIAMLGYATDSGGSLPPAASYTVQDSDGWWRHVPGWECWWDRAPGYRQAANFAGNYAVDGNNAITCITNGVLWSYMARGLDPYACPTHVATVRAGIKRSYSMNIAVSGANIMTMGGQVNTVLLGDDRNIGIVGDSAFGTNEVAQWHNRSKGNVVYMDGHVSKFP